MLDELALNWLKEGVHQEEIYLALVGRVLKQKNISRLKATYLVNYVPSNSFRYNLGVAVGVVVAGKLLDSLEWLGDVSEHLI